MTSVSHSVEGDFSQAAQCWQLEKLYLDLANAKGKGLTPLEKKFLQGLLCGYSPAEIATHVYETASSSSVRVYLSNGIYKYLQELLFHKTGELIKIKNWSHVTHLLEKVGYRKLYSLNNNSHLYPKPLEKERINWEENIDIDNFFGREEEINQLKTWIIEERCRLVSVLGIKGIGKTSLTVKLVEQIDSEFDLVIWRSLNHSPDCEDLIKDLITLISPEENENFLPSYSGLSHLMLLLRSRRCLLVFNQFDPVINVSGYQELLRRIREEHHLSCCLLTSRESSLKLTFRKNKVKSLFLQPLPPDIARQILLKHDLKGSPSDYNTLLQHYANNPLMLSIVSLTIQQYFNGEVREFLGSRLVVFTEIRQGFEEEFNKLSPVEKQMMYTLAIHEKIEVNQDLEVLHRLQRRSLLTPHPYRFTHPLWKTYLLETLVSQVPLLV